jgi:nicotinate-nucleotide adenylyltransferase
VAAKALDALGLEAVWFVPAAAPPHKASHANGLPVTPLAHRVAMLETALNDRPGCVLSLIEAERREPSYTIDTLRILQQRFGMATEFFFIVGEDAFAEINTWKEYERLPFLAHLVVISRPTHTMATIKAIIERHYPGLPGNAKGTCWSVEGLRGSIRILAMPPVEISSTTIRQRRLAGLSIQGMVPSGVAEYIERHGLYTT